MVKTNSFQKIVLPNGLTLILYPMKSVMSAFAVLYVRVGTTYERQDERGISHFTEHATLLGTKKFPSKLALSYEAQKLGANFDGWTDRFATAYWIKLPYTNLKEGVNFLDELVSSPLLDEEQILKEKDIVLSEFNDFWHNPERKFWHEVWRKRFKQKEHPYSYRAMGIPETIKNFDKNLVLSWREKYYHPNNMILSIAGNFEPKKIEALVKETLGKLKKGKSSQEPKFASKDYSDFLIYHQADPRSQITFYVSMPTLGWREITRKERMEFRRLNYILGGGSGSHLFQRLRQKERFVYSTEAAINLYPWMGAFEISGSTDIEKLIPALISTKEEILRLKDKGVQKQEFELAKNFFDFSNLLMFDNPKDIAYFLGDQEFDEQEVWLPEKYKEIGEKITTKDLNKLAKRFFDFSRVNIGLLGKIPQQTLPKIKKVFKTPTL